ncbi:MAG: hypothetical protein ABIA91_02550, partial [Patescibacteria group bacterium]
MNKIKFLPILGIIFLVTILNIFLIKSVVLGVLFGIIYLSVFSYYLGKNLFSEKNKCFSWLLGFVFLLTLIIICGTIIYYTIGLFNWSIAVILLVPLICIFILQKKHACHPESPHCHPELVSGSSNENSKMPKQVRHDKNKKTKSLYLLDIIYIGFIIYLFCILFSHQTNNSIVSPWQVVPSYFFIIYFIATALLMYKIFKFP